MRICMLLDAVYPTDIRVAKEAQALVDDDHEVFVLSFADETKPERESVNGATVIRRPLQEGFVGFRGAIPGSRYLLTQVSEPWVAATEDVVRTEGIDVLHVHDLPLVKTGLVAGERCHVPVVADLHENWPEAIRQYRKAVTRRRWTAPRYLARRAATPIRRLKRLERYCVRRADRVIAVAEEGRAHYLRDCGAPPEAVHVISNVVDLDTFDSAGIEPVGYDDEFVLSYIGAISAHRGLDTVIRAMPAIVRRVPNARLLIVGGGPSRELGLERLCATVGVSDRVTFTGQVPFEQVPSFIAASDACLVPHKANEHTATTIPHKLFQYMAMRRPVVVSDVAPLARIVRETDAGLIFPADDERAVANAVIDLAERPERAAELGANGREAVERKYNWRTEAEKLTDLYRQLPPSESVREGAPTASGR